VSTKRAARPRIALTVQYVAAARHLPTRSQLRTWACAALEHDALITVRLVDRPEGRALNRRFRGKDHATNVLTFVIRDTAPFEGDLALCVPVVAREARALGIRLAAHYAHLVVHGILHLQGYRHDNDADARLMEERESQIVRKLGYSDPYGGEKRKALPRRATAAGRRELREPPHG